jgi:hypothetical protein
LYYYHRHQKDIDKPFLAIRKWFKRKFGWFSRIFRSKSAVTCSPIVDLEGGINEGNQGEREGREQDKEGREITVESAEEDDGVESLRPETVYEDALEVPMSDRDPIRTQTI